MKSFDRKIFCGIFFITLLILPLMGGAVYCLHKVVTSQREFIDLYGQQLLLVKDLRRDLVEERASMSNYILTGHAMGLDGFHQAHRDFEEHFGSIGRLVKNPTVRKDLDDIATTERQTFDLAAAGIAMKQSKVSINDVNNYFHEHAGAGIRALNAAIDSFVANTTYSFEKAKSDNEQTSERIVKVLAFAALLSVLLCLAAAALLMNLVRKKKAFDQMNELLLQKEKQLSSARKETVEVVAHDLRNPLASMIMCAQLGLSGKVESSEGPEEFQKIFQVILKSAESMKNLIDSLLDHAKIESGSLSLNKKEHDLDLLLRSVVARFEPIAAKSKIRLSYELTGELPPISFDSVRIDQVVSNLISNAIKFSSAGGSIRVALVDQVASALVSVADTGCGLNHEQAEHVFDRYWQVKETASRGNGLGLAIARAVVNAHNGKIWVESERGQGSTFSFYIPIETPRPSASPKFLPQTDLNRHEMPI